MKETDDIYYVMDEEKDIDDSPLNFAAYEDEDREEIIEEKEEKAVKERSPFTLMLEIMFNPVEGWKKMRRRKYTVEKVQSGCFYPLLALLAVSRFAEFFYSVNVNLSQVVTEAVVEFVSYFFGYFCILMLLNWLLPKKIAEAFDDNFGKNYIVVSLSTLAMFSIIMNILPMIWPILIFLPIWTIYIMFKGSRFFKMAESHSLKFIVITCGAVIGVPVLLDWAMMSILPY